MAKTTIGKSMCVCVCVQSVCVFVCNPCVCLWPMFHRKLRSFWACLKHCKGGHFRCVFTFEMTCSIRVCVYEGVPTMKSVCLWAVSPNFNGRSRGSWGGPHDSQKVLIFRQRACLQSATFWCPGKVCFYTWNGKGGKTGPFIIAETPQLAKQAIFNGWNAPGGKTGHF